MQIENDEDTYDPVLTEREIEYDGFKAIAVTHDRGGDMFTDVLDEDREHLFGVFGNPSDGELYGWLMAYVIGYRSGVSYGRSDVRTAIVRALGL